MKRRCWLLLSIFVLLTCMGAAAPKALAGANGIIPYFGYCNVMSNNTSNGIGTVITAQVFDPNGSVPSTITTISIEGPQSFSAAMAPGNYNASSGLFTMALPQQPAAGEYKFTVTNSIGDSAVSYYYISSSATAPIVDSSTFVAYGAPLAPTLCWSDVPGYRGNLLFKAVIYDSSGNVVWTSSLTGLSNVSVPPGVLNSGASYWWSVVAVDNARPEVTDNQSVSGQVPLAIGASYPGFLYARVYTLTVSDPTPVAVLDTQVVLPEGASQSDISSFTVTGPNGFSYSFQLADYSNPSGTIVSAYNALQNALTTLSGFYTFTVVLGTGEGAVTAYSYHYFVSNVLPLVDAGSLQASGTNLTPVFTWAAPKNPGVPCFTR